MREARNKTGLHIMWAPGVWFWWCLYSCLSFQIVQLSRRNKQPNCTSPPPPSSRTENLELQRGKYKTIFSSVLLPLEISVPLLKKFKHGIQKTRKKNRCSQLLNMCGKNHRTSEIDKYIVWAYMAGRKVENSKSNLLSIWFPSSSWCLAKKPNRCTFET